MKLFTLLDVGYSECYSMDDIGNGRQTGNSMVDRVPVGYAGNLYPSNFFVPDTTQVPELEKSPRISMQHSFN